MVDSIKVLGGEKLSSKIQTLFEAKQLGFEFPKIPGVTPSKSYRKLVYFPDKESKVRVIAQLDYWSQTSLRALHFYLFRVLRNIHQDCTFDQGKFQELVLNKGSKYYSIDLTACTDRFPIQFIGQVLKSILPHDYIDK